LQIAIDWEALKLGVYCSCLYLDKPVENTILFLQNFSLIKRTNKNIIFLLAKRLAITHLMTFGIHLT